MALRVFASLGVLVGRLGLVGSLVGGLAASASLVGGCAFSGSSGQDVPADAAVDAEIDGTPVTNTCPATYQIVVGTPLTSRYRKLDTAKSWDVQAGLCAADGAHLVVLDSEAERRAIETFGANTRGLFWIGLTDGETEGVWKTVKGQVVTAGELAPLWGAGQPAMGPAAENEDCMLVGQAGARTYYDFTCASSYVAVCECD